MPGGRRLEGRRPPPRSPPRPGRGRSGPSSSAAARTAGSRCSPGARGRSAGTECRRTAPGSGAQRLGSPPRRPRSFPGTMTVIRKIGGSVAGSGSTPSIVRRSVGPATNMTSSGGSPSSEVGHGLERLPGVLERDRDVAHLERPERHEGRTRTRSRRRSCRRRRGAPRAAPGRRPRPRHDDRSIGGDDLGPDEVVAGQAAGAHEVADPAGQRQPADPGVAERAAGRRQAMRRGRGVDVLPQRAALGARDAAARDRPPRGASRAGRRRARRRRRRGPRRSGRRRGPRSAGPAARAARTAATTSVRRAALDDAAGRRSIIPLNDCRASS